MKDMKGYVPDHWVLDEALTLIRSLQPETRRFNYHLCLGGSVLNKGKSDKDLDLFFLPMNNGQDPDLPGLHDWLCSLWGDGEKLGGDDERYEEDEGDYSLKVKFTYSGLRIDVFVIGGMEEETSKVPKLSAQPGGIVGYGIPAAVNDVGGTWQGITRTNEPMWRVIQQEAPATVRNAIDWDAVARRIFDDRGGI